MATNFYEMETNIHFGDAPSVYAGYYVSGSSHAAQATPFESVEVRGMFHRAIQQRFPGKDAYRIAAAGTLCYGADKEDDGDWGWDLLVKELDHMDDYEAVHDIYDAVVNEQYHHHVN